MVLAGLKILDVGTMVAGPFAATLAADHGADVVKIEQPDVGDAIREWSPLKDGRSLWWKVTARNKRLISLDLRKPRGRELFLELAREADAVIENFRPGTFARWGLSYDELAAVNPRLVLVHVSGYGQTGPYAHRPGYGTIAEGMSGIPSFTGFADGPPTLSAFPLADCLAGTFALVGLLSAIYERDVAGSGRGQEVDVSLYEPVFRLVESQVIGYDQLGIVKQRRGNRIEEDSPRNAFATRDDAWITISASSDRTFARLAEAIGRPELATDPRFADNLSRIANDVALDELIAAWMRERTADEIMAILESHDVVAGRIYTVEDIFRDPQYLARENIVAVDDPDFGTVRMPGVVPRFSRSPGAVRWPGGRLGEHNGQVFGELGLGADQLAELRAEGVV
jgi:crotonobetainyl-CoA:carnitine CoA-transferase CaiB-like acyl-CoA transferase